MNSQEKIWKIYSYIKDNLYLCRPDITVNNIGLNSALIFGIMTSLVNGKELIYGEYGLGKTTSSESIISLMYGFPKEIVLASTLKGNPEQTEEKMIARPNLGDLNKGIENVIWSDFVLVGPKIIDELNRLPAGKQNILLEGTDRGIWKYLNDFLQNDNLAIYSTSNYKDAGNTEVIPPLLDRFDVAVESKHPGINNLRYRRAGTRQDQLSDPDISLKMFGLMNTEKDYSIFNEKLKVLRDEFKKKLSDRINIELFSVGEHENIRDEIKNTGLSKEAIMFYDIFTAELSNCQMYGQKRTNEQCKIACHYSNYLCNKISNCLSVRSDSSIKNYSAALAWLFGKNEITVEHLASVLPYVIWHKTQFKKEYISEFETQERNDPLQLFIAKQSVTALQRRFAEIRPLQESVISALKNGNEALAKRIATQSDNPVIPQYLML